jgi:hypothetical protein
MQTVKNTYNQNNQAAQMKRKPNSTLSRQQREPVHILSLNILGKAS